VVQNLLLGFVAHAWPEMRELIDNQQEWNVEEVPEKHHRKGIVQYRVK